MKRKKSYAELKAQLYRLDKRMSELSHDITSYNIASGKRGKAIKRRKKLHKKHNWLFGSL